MPNSEKYGALTRYLESCGDDEIVLTFEDVSNKVNGLPQSAYLYGTTWSKDGTIGAAGIKAGYITRANFSERKVTFIKGTPKIKTEKSLASQQPELSAVLDIEVAIEKIRKYYETTNDGKHTRYRSWEHCYRAFHEHRNSPDKLDFLCLHLAWYLASWGMLRNSFLLERDYLVHKQAVSILTSGRFESLYENDYTSLTIPLSIEASKEIRSAYSEGSVTDTLTTKILLGVLGCTPAYDRYFKNAARKYKVCSGQWGERSLKSLWRYYEVHHEALEKLRYEIALDELSYPPMKIMDMCLWQIGFDEEINNKETN